MRLGPGFLSSLERPLFQADAASIMAICATLIATRGTQDGCHHPGPEGLLCCTDDSVLKTEHLLLHRTLQRSYGELAVRVTQPVVRRTVHESSGMNSSSLEVVVLLAMHAAADTESLRTRLVEVQPQINSSECLRLPQTVLLN